MQDVATAYKSQMGRGDFYPLSALVLFIKNADRASELIKIASEAGVRPVTFVDRKVRTHEASSPFTVFLESDLKYIGLAIKLESKYCSHILINNRPVECLLHTFHPAREGCHAPQVYVS